MALARRHSVGLVHVHHGYRAYEVIGTCRRLGLPLVISLHGHDITGYVEEPSREPPELSLAGSAYQGLAGPPAGRPAPLDLAAEAALVRFLWKAAPLLTLAHDVGRGGLEAALADAAEWSGRPADVDLPDEPRWGAAVLALSRDLVPRLGSKGLVKIGEVR